MQLKLNFLDGSVPEAGVWDAVEDAHRAVVIEALARLFAKVTVAHRAEEPRDE